MVFAQLGEHLVNIGVGLDVEIDAHAHHSIVGADGVHVVHVIHASHLFLDRRRDGLRDCLRITANKRCLNTDFRRNDFRKLGNGQIEHRNRADDDDQNSDHYRYNRAIDEEAVHAELRPLPVRGCLHSEGELLV